MTLSEEDLPDSIKTFGSDIAVMGREFGQQISQSAAIIAHAVADLKTYQPRLSVDVDDDVLSTWHNTVSTVETTISSFLEQVDKVVGTGERSIMEMIDSWEYSVGSIKLIMMDGYFTIKYIAYISLLMTLTICLYKTFRFARKDIMVCLAVGMAIQGLVMLPHSEVSHAGTGRNDGLPVGAIVAFAGNMVLPRGWVMCDGSAVSRSMYPQLYARIGEFTPDLTRTPAGARVTDPSTGNSESQNSVYSVQYGIKASDT